MVILGAEERQSPAGENITLPATLPAAALVGPRTPRVVVLARRCASVPVVSTTGVGPDLAGKAAVGRKLIAVVYADMVGYSRLIGLDDAGTLRRLRTLRRALIDPAIREHGGSVAQTGGDLLLVAFDSIDGAVRCAVKIQQQVPVYDGDQPPDRRIRFRIGINIGDVIPDGTDLHGDGVNIAARLEAACPVGGICVSRSVRDHVHGRLDLAFEPIGELTLKNIARPVEAFVVRLDSASEALATSAGPQTSEAVRARWPLSAALVGLIVVALAGAGWWVRPRVAPQSGAEVPDVLSLTSGPSIEVIPFVNLSGDPEQEFFSRGIANDLTTALSRFRSLSVMAEFKLELQASADGGEARLP